MKHWGLRCQGSVAALLPASAFAHGGHGMEPGFWHDVSHALQGGLPFVLIAVLMGLLAISWSVRRP